LVRSLWHNCSPLTSPESENLKFTEKGGFCQRKYGKNGGNTTGKQLVAKI